MADGKAIIRDTIDAVVIDPGAPFDVAKTFVIRHYAFGGLRTLQRYRGEFFEWTGTFYC